MANFYCTTCHNLNHPNIKIKHFGLFQNNKDIFLIIKSWDTWQHIICSLVHQKSRILVASDNTYMISQRMKAYFVDFFFHPNSLSFATNVVYNLSNVTIKILAANVACN
jgi:hypothetical protein